MTDDNTPMSALEAVQSVAASSAAEPTTPTNEQPSASADATVPPVQTEGAPAVTDNPSTDGKPAGGAPPEERWPAILDNARTKAVEEYREKYGWAEQIDQTQLHEMARFYERAAKDPYAHVEDAVADMLARPEYAPKVKSLAARILGQRGAASPNADVDIEPDIPVLDDQGREVTRAYSADAMKQLLQRELQKAINPLSEDLKTRKAQADEAERHRQQTEYVTRETSRIGSMLSGLPKYGEHTEPIKARIAELARLPEWGQSSPESIAYRAYIDVVYPKLTASAQSDVLDSLKQKAGAQMEKPSSSSATPLQRPTNVRDLEKTIASLAGSMR